MTPGKTLLRFSRQQPLGAVGGLFILCMVLAALFAELLATYDPIRTDAEHTLSRRIIHGARVSLMVGLASTLLGSVLGGVIGLLSGYFGGRADLVTQRVMDILQGLPLLILALVLAAALGPSIPNVI